MLGRVCCEDFLEILLCCGNGIGHAAHKLLRGMYERAVTLSYLHDNPAEIDDFLDFHFVNQRKLMIVSNDSMGQVFTEEMKEDIENGFQRVKDRFMIADCKECGTKRLNHSWNKLDLVAMAKKTSLGKLLVPGYFIPLRQSHATVASVFSRMSPTDNGGIAFVDAAQRQEADNAIRVAHNLVLDVLRVQDEHFSVPGLKELNELCLQDFIDIWKKN